MCPGAARSASPKKGGAALYSRHSRLRSEKSRTGVDLARQCHTRRKKRDRIGLLATALERMRYQIDIQSGGSALVQKCDSIII
jgi:hypothetical protein